MPEGGYSSTQVCSITKVPYGTLYEWLSTGLITPSLVKPQGRGKHARWDYRDILAIQTIQRLRDNGLSMQGLRRVVPYLQQQLDIEHPLGECYLVTDGHECYLVDGAQLLRLVRQQGQMTLFHLLDLRSTDKQLRTRMRAKAKNKKHAKVSPHQNRPAHCRRSA